jgi:hypothetical protein
MLIMEFFKFSTCRDYVQRRKWVRKQIQISQTVPRHRSTSPASPLSQPHRLPIFQSEHILPVGTNHNSRRILSSFLSQFQTKPSLMPSEMQISKHRKETQQKKNSAISGIDTSAFLLDRGRRMRSFEGSPWVRREMAPCRKAQTVLLYGLG